eukprot:CAMPEP_0117666958 /NCGR_PEP_ID=MMETSP0804-20121206/10678_1 /TAXON_ID=1074897 /ORGANISM="Tetraselmis astigmatica, Strain CCMP880" /LENGTH=668 /DNA_ID=CAMNT_0005474587 /DNA_START=110 /DNA_END=2113 /DNA_ORIENTATION=+
MAALPAEAAAFLSLDGGEAQHEESLEALLRQMRAGKLSVMDLVLGLGEHLVTEVDPERARATLLLAEVMEQAPELLQPEQLLTLGPSSGSGSGTGRLRPTLKGCLALVGRKNIAAPSPLATLQGSVAAGMAKGLMEDVHVQSLQAADRLQALRLLLALLKDYGPSLAESDVDAMEAVIRAIDTEKDPRCLLVAFDCVRHLAALYPPLGTANPDADAEQWTELHSCIACYFPIAYHPPRGMPEAVTRAELVSGLEAALASHPRFAPHTVPLLLEKAASPSQRDMDDSMSGLVACCVAWGEAMMGDHIEEVWRMLELHLAGEDDADAERAARCLKLCCRALSQDKGEGGKEEPPLGALHRRALDDGLWTGWMTSLQELAAQPGTPSTSAIAKTAAQAEHSCRALAAVGGSSPQACRAALNMTLPILMDTAMGQRFLQGMGPSPAAAAACRGIALTSLKTMVNSAHELVAFECTKHGRAPQPPPLGDYAKELAATAAYFDEAEDNALDTEPSISIMRLQLLGVLLNTPAGTPPALASPSMDALVERLLSIIESAAPAPSEPASEPQTQPGKEPQSLEDAPGLACTILQHSAATLRGCPAYGAALPRLLAAVASHTESMEEGEGEGTLPCWRGAWPLRALLSMSESDPGFRAGAVAGLGQLVAEQMVGAMAA